MEVKSARRPPAPPPPRFGVAAPGTVAPQLEWEPPEHSGGMPLTGFTVFMLREGQEPTLLAQVGPEVHNCSLPTETGAAGSVSAWYYGFQVSASNAKGEGDRSAPGPRPTPFDSTRFDAERTAMFRIFDKHGEQGSEAVNTFCERTSGSGELAMVAASHGAGPSIVSGTLDRLRRAGLAWEQAGGDPGGAAAVREDIDGATAHEIAIAMLLHVWDVLVPGARAKPCFSIARMAVISGRRPGSDRWEGPGPPGNATAGRRAWSRRLPRMRQW